MNRRTVTSAVAAAALSALALAGGAYGQATTERFHDVQTTVDTGIDFYPCFEGIVGTG